MRHQLTPALLVALGVVAFVGAPCPINVDEPECEDDSDCDDDEECNDGSCEEKSGGSGSPGGIGDLQLRNYCEHIAQCFEGQGGITVDDCMTQARASIAQYAQDPTCRAYLAGLGPLLTCYTAADCTEITTGQVCVDETNALTEASTTCNAINGEGEGEGEPLFDAGPGETPICDGFIGANDGCDCGCNEHDPDCDAVGGGCDTSGCCLDPPQNGCEFCN